MSLRRSVLGRVLLLGTLATLASAQAAPRPQPYCIRGVALDRAGERKGTLVLRDGAITAILDEAAPVPPGTRVLEGAGLICLPAFLDAFARQGYTARPPVKDQDIPPNEQADVGVDMRLANRKGIEPAFRVVEALAMTKDQSEAWRKSGFGVALLAPGGELLSGASALATTREAAMRDLVVRDEVFEHAAFAASGPGYPSTLMGYFAQLRQFLLDSKRQRELERRSAQGHGGVRPPFDGDLATGVGLLDGERRLVCEASGADDVERWLRLADEFGVKLDVSGGLEAWRVRELLAERGMTVVLTLDWGKEVKDPRPKAEKTPEAAASETAEKKDEKEAAEAKDPPQADAAAEKESADTTNVAATAEKSAADEPAADEAKQWEYEEPYTVRLERRTKWEQGRDCALRLDEAGVRIVFGTASGKPSELLGHVRELVKAGLPAEKALAGLTSDAASFLGVERFLGRVEPGYDATLTLWRSDPLTDEKASVAWIFVDGFPTEFKEEKKDKPTGPPGKGVDPSGKWELEFVVEGEGVKTAQLELDMEEDGAVTGSIEVENPMGGAKVRTDVEGHVAGDELTLECTLQFGEFAVETNMTGTIADDEFDGKSTFKGPWSDEPMTQSFKGKRKPE